MMRKLGTFTKSKARASPDPLFAQPDEIFGDYLRILSEKIDLKPFNMRIKAPFIQFSLNSLFAAH